MAIEKKSVNTFWCIEDNFWKIYLTPENLNPQISRSLKKIIVESDGDFGEKTWKVYLTPEDQKKDKNFQKFLEKPKEYTIEESISALRKEIRENITFQKFTARIQKNDIAMREGKTEIQETDWAYRVGIISGGISSLSTIIIATMLFLRIGSLLMVPVRNLQNISQQQAFQNSSLIPANTNYALVDVAFGVTAFFAVAGFFLNSVSAWFLQKEKEEGQLYEKNMVKLMERLIIIENEILKKTEIIENLIDKLKKTNSQNISTVNKKDEGGFYDDILMLIDSKNDMGVYEKIDEITKALEDVSYYKINEIMIQLFKAKLLSKIDSDISEKEKNIIENSLSIEEIFSSFKNDKLYPNLKNYLYIAENYLLEIWQNKNKLLAISSLVRLIENVLGENPQMLANFSLFIDFSLDKDFSKLPHKFKIIHERISDVFKDERKHKNITGYIKKIRSKSIKPQDFIQECVFFVGDTRRFQEYHIFSRILEEPVDKISVSEKIYSTPSAKKEKTNSSHSNCLLKATLPKLGTLIEFEEHNAKADGDCGFTCLGTDREKLSEKLLSSKNSKEHREFLSEEIINAFVTYDATSGEEGLKPYDIENWQNYYHTWKQKEKEFDKLFCEIQNKLSDKKLITQDNIDDSIRWLKNNNKSSEAELLMKKKLVVFQASEKLKTFSESINVFEYYVNALKSNRLWLGYSSALLYAKLANITLYIWEKNTKNKNQLELIDHHIGDGNVSDGFHILHTDGFTHFNFLSESNPRKEKIDINPISLIQDSQQKNTAKSGSGSGKFFKDDSVTGNQIRENIASTQIQSTEINDSEKKHELTDHTSKSKSSEEDSPSSTDSIVIELPKMKSG